MLFNCLDDIQELYFCGQCVAMEYEGHAIWAIPAIQFYAATALSQTPYVGFN